MTQTPAGPDASEIDVLARTLWGEARGESDAAVRAVAHVILNRMARSASCQAQHGKPYWWGGPAASAVCHAPWQFSCWLPGDPNLAKMKMVTDKDPRFRFCLLVARQALTGQLMVDDTHGADSYYSVDIQPPSWTRKAVLTAAIGHFRFYRTC
jgi:N-acetylmuramoyl-L-alanine amidase